MLTQPITVPAAGFNPPSSAEKLGDIKGNLVLMLFSRETVFLSQIVSPDSERYFFCFLAQGPLVKLPGQAMDREVLRLLCRKCCASSNFENCDSENHHRRLDDERRGKSSASRTKRQRQTFQKNLEQFVLSLHAKAKEIRKRERPNHLDDMFSHASYRMITKTLTYCIELLGP